MNRFANLETWLRNWLSNWPEGRAFRVVSEVGATIGTDRGPVRTDNQDRAIIMRMLAPDRNQSYVCAVVCDGMGGMRDGAACATIAIASFVSGLIAQSEGVDLSVSAAPISLLQTAVMAANGAVFDFARGNGGTTLSALLIASSGNAYWTNIGDSRVYASRSDVEATPALHKITTDDNLEDAFGGKGKELVQFVGIGQGLVAHADRMYPTTVSAIITTDGIHSIGPELIGPIFEKAPNYKSGTERLLAAANWVSGADNGTIIGVSIAEALHSLHANGSAENFITIELWKPGDLGQIVIPMIECPRPLSESDTVRSPIASAKRVSPPVKAKRQRTSKRKVEQAQLEIDVNYERKSGDDENR